MRTRYSVVRNLIGLALISGASACGLSSDSIPAYVMNTTESSTQTVSVNSAAAVPLTATVRDQDQNPIEGIEVLWNIKSGAGTISSTTTTTNGDGEATVTYTAGATVGKTLIYATVPRVGSSVSFTMTVK